MVAVRKFSNCLVFLAVCVCLQHHEVHAQNTIFGQIIEGVANLIMALLTSNTGTGRIMGGTTVSSRSDSPYAAFIAIQPIDFPIINKIIRIPLCTATILTSTKLITGASCFKVFEDLTRVAVVGALKTIKKDWAHPIALATSLAKPLIQTRLKTYSSVVLSDTDCSSKIASVANLGTGTPFDSALLVGVTNQMICLNSVSGSGACFIDNGGPMINSEGKLVGVLGLLLNCGDPASVTVGNELSGEHLIWVKQQTGL
ncbi:unnamed protein product [Notodromas monacha]|uniref:Peptidase S1 domain-containing protein n=1 Tax=Notodromas monacha TaxID=399045 RepID=A0A7R9GCS8_9CRUS|nr:unnamed protein product [Notodromas monacha]CAG0917782.1 unnamed protein product [Notodromas monacha]